MCVPWLTRYFDRIFSWYIALEPLMSVTSETISSPDNESQCLHVICVFENVPWSPAIQRSALLILTAQKNSQSMVWHFLIWMHEKSVNKAQWVHYNGKYKIILSFDITRCCTELYLVLHYLDNFGKCYLLHLNFYMYIWSF